MKRTYLSLAALVTLCFSLLLISGCGSSGNKEGDGPVATVGSTQCSQCHSATVDPLTGESIVAQFDTSFHNLAGQGCESCHGNGGQHQGKGPIPYPDPSADNGTRCATCHDGTTAVATNVTTKFADSLHANVAQKTTSPCRRCHTHEGAVLGFANGFTGDVAVLDNAAFQAAFPAQAAFSPFACTTCHAHGGGLRQVKARDQYTVGGVPTGTGLNIVNWNPSQTNKANDVYNFCTSCHYLKTYDGAYTMASGTVASGTAAVGHHEDDWYRVIATTHNNNTDNVTNGISGYVIRIPKTSATAYASTTDPQARACFDCHGHEAKTGTRYANPSNSSYDTTKATIYTDWAQSPHAGGLLEAKVNAAGASANSVALVDTVMDAKVDGTALPSGVSAEPWIHYDWSATNRQDCQRCHTATGASNYLNGPASYDKTKNDFQHLSGWTTSSKSSTQRELLYCWACHSNAAAGVVRTPGAITAEYNFNGAKAQFPDVEKSNVCIACHQGRDSGESITAKADSTFNNLSFVNSHYMATAGLMYVKIGFTAFIDPATVIGTSTYGKSLTSTEDGGALSSTHRKFGTTAINGDSHNPTVFTPGNFDSNGPCVTCHMQATGQATRTTSHTFAINGNAFDQVCVNCHTKEGTTTLTAANFDAAFLVPQEEVFQDALTLALTVLQSKYNITYNQAAYPYFYDVTAGNVAVKDWTRSGALTNAQAKKLMGACFNINLLKREPGAFAHARTYSRRLIYDTIDFLDDKTINLSVSDTAVATLPAVYGKHATKAYTDSTRTTLQAPTTEAMLFLKNYSRSTGLWSSPERP